MAAIPEVASGVLGGEADGDAIVPAASQGLSTAAPDLHAVAIYGCHRTNRACIDLYVTDGDVVRLPDSLERTTE